MAIRMVRPDAQGRIRLDGARADRWYSVAVGPHGKITLTPIKDDTKEERQ